MLLRGLNVLVLNEVTGAVMSSRWFDTYESKERLSRGIPQKFETRKDNLFCYKGG